MEAMAVAEGGGGDAKYVIPKREILNPMDLDKWLKSDAYHECIGFLETLNEAARGKPLSCPLTPSPTLPALLAFMDKVDELIDQTPVIEQPQRFGNKAFAILYKKLKECLGDLLRPALPENLHCCIEEISVYFLESLGNSTRIDYGTGHELSFIMFMYCLFRVGALDSNKADDKTAAVTQLFNRYITLARKLQVTYRMEPAGSHGVWSLDDYQFIPFIFGSSQFVGNPIIEPSSFTDPGSVSRLAPEYMFLACIEYIQKVKSGPFHEHSNQLWNISGTQSWSKINQGLIKMFKAEVLCKFPVVQHVLFGSLFSIKPFDASKKAHFGKPTGSLSSGIRGISLPPKLEPEGTASSN